MALISRKYVKQNIIPLLFRLRGGKDLWAEQDLKRYGIGVTKTSDACDIEVPAVMDEQAEICMPRFVTHFDPTYVYRFDYETHRDCVKRWGAIVLPWGKALQSGVNSHMPRLAALYPRSWGRKRRERLIVAPWPHSFMGYGDFCMCILPRLCRAVAELSDQEKSNACIALPFSKGDWARQLVELIGIPRERQIDTLTENFGLTKDGVAISVNSQPGVWAGPHDFAQLWRALPRSIPQSGTKRYFIQRKGSRKLMHEEKLYQAIKEFGFEIVEDKARTVEEQMHLFRQAECVVGPHGAGLSNLLWGPHSVKLLEVQSISWILPSFRILSAIRASSYHLMVDRTHGGEARIEEGSNYGDLSIDPVLFVRAVQRMCEDAS